MTDHTDHHAPEGLRTRGTIVVVPGRGETRATYGRLAARLAAERLPRPRRRRTGPGGGGSRGALRH
ncbi:hypothetical protein STENM36S_01857 [Streptomyces tendae]